MNYLKEMFKNKDKKAIYNLLVLFAAGVVILIISGTFFKSGKNGPYESVATAVTQQDAAEPDYARQLEQRLEETLSYVAGAGEVKVMITLRYGRESFIAKDINTNVSNMTENDSQGGSRESRTQTSGETTVRNGSDAPFVFKEAAPVIEGVIIIAKGGDDVFVKDALTKAAYTVLGIEPHMVQVLKMR